MQDQLLLMPSGHKHFFNAIRRNLQSEVCSYSDFCNTAFLERHIEKQAIFLYEEITK